MIALDYKAVSQSLNRPGEALVTYRCIHLLCFMILRCSGIDVDAQLHTHIFDHETTLASFLTISLTMTSISDT